MLEPLVIAYVGDEHRGLDLIQALDQRLRRPVHLLTTDAAELDGLLTETVVDAVVCGMIESDGLQTVVDAVGAHDPEIPVCDLSGYVAVVPEAVSLYKIYPGESRSEAVDTLVGNVLGSSTRRETHEPRTLGQYLALDSEWIVTDWDPRLASWTGATPEQAVGSSLWELLPSWEDAEIGRLCHTVADDRESQTTAVYHDPVSRWFDLRVIPLEAGGIECFFRDVTDHRESELGGATFENMLERITDAFFALDNEDRFVLLNSDAEQILDVDAEAVTGVRFWDAFPAAMSSRFYREFTEAMQSQEPTSFEERYRPRDQWFEVNAYPSEDGLSVFLRDITEQVELQQKLESLHGITRELIVAGSDAEIASGTIDAAEDVLGFSLVALWRYNDATDRLDPLAWSDGIDDRVGELEPLGRDSEFIWEVYETGDSRLLGSVPATTPTSHHPGNVTSELLVPIGDYGVLGAYADECDAFDETDADLFRLLASTVESAFARTLRERQLAQRNERLNDFASVVSHDLRNPLNVASAHTELARGTDDVDPHLDKIDDSLTRMEDLIEDLLARARGDQDLDREPLSVAKSAREAWSGVETDGASLEIETDASLDADPDRLQQLFENLVRNSIEHGGQGVTIRVGTAENGFFVADDGAGIPEDKRDEIFEQGVTHSDSGTGYGLAIVTDIVDGHGWSIAVGESQYGGARFDIENIRSLTDPREVRS
ncbi:MAG: PAS domain-containing protein [Halovenus sp.]